VETITELESSTQLIVMGKRGELADFNTLHLGSNLERVARTARRPILVASRAFQPINRFVIAYDGGPSVLKAMDYVINRPLLQGLECHLLRIGPDNAANRRKVEEAATPLTQAGFAVKIAIEQGQTEAVLAAYVKSNDMDLLVMGAYGHSQIRTLIIGSTTSVMLRSCLIPVLMFR
jgi:nucleotide-binding universal stress UspA family protein